MTTEAPLPFLMRFAEPLDEEPAAPADSPRRWADVRGATKKTGIGGETTDDD